MAAQVKSHPHHVRADSGVNGVDGIDSISKTLATAQGLCTAISSFATENGVQALSELLALLPKREAEIKERDATIQDLNARLADKENYHGAYSLKQLSYFQRRYDEWKTEKLTMESEGEELRAAFAEKEQRMLGLEEELKGCRKRVDDLEDAHTTVTKNLKERSQQLGNTQARLNTTLTSVAESDKRLKESDQEIATLQQSYEDEEKKYSRLEQDFIKTEERLRALEEYCVEIKSLNLPKVADRFEGLWKSGMALIKDFFDQDLPEDSLQSDWTKLREKGILEQRIPLPKSNSDIAKRMRVAVVLSNLARLMDKMICQPTFLLDEESGLRELLRNQAAIDSDKEIYTRGILLSMDLDEQETNSQECIGIIVHELLNTVNAKVILVPGTLEAFKSRLEGFLTKFRDHWKAIQRGEQKLEQSFSYYTPTDLSWHVFDLQAEGIDNSIASNATGNLEDDIVIFPRLYLISMEAEPDPITRGYVLPKAHLDAAEGEIRKVQSTTPFARGPSGRPRIRPARTMSMSKEGASGVRNGDRFLA